jgi:sulfate transport system permease protein
LSTAAPDLSLTPLPPRPVSPRRRRDVLPGRRLALGYTLTYLGLLVLLPLAGLALRAGQMSWADFWATVWGDGEVRAAYRLSFQASAAAALIDSVFGLIVAWVLVRYRFPGRRLLDAVVDFPFALPTAVAGLTFASLYGDVKWIGDVKVGTWLTRGLNALGMDVGPETLSGLDQFRCIVMLMFVGLPFTVRSVQSVLQDWDVEAERAAASLGAGRWRTFRRVVMPELLPAYLSGLALAFARSIGEYGSIVFVLSGQFGAEIVPMKIAKELASVTPEGELRATAIGVVLLGASLVILMLINGIEWWSRRHER